VVTRSLRRARRAWVVCGGLCAAALLPFMADWDMMRGGFAWVTIVGFAAFAAGVTGVVLRRRARWDHDLAAETADLIAQWTVPDALWRRVTGRLFQQQTMVKRWLLLIVWFWCIVIGIGFVIVDPEDGWAVAVVMGLLMAITAVAAVALPRRRRHRLATAPHRVAVGRTRVLLGDEWHSWGGPGSRLRHARLADQDGEHWLDVRYSYLSRVGVLTECVLLPVPVEALADAQRAVDTLAGA
jgi:peptidoglycan/LPS O-acetylase OafA/YrhL